jgi:hypothetical protein
MLSSYRDALLCTLEAVVCTWDERHVEMGLATHELAVFPSSEHRQGPKSYRLARLASS